MSLTVGGYHQGYTHPHHHPHHPQPHHYHPAATAAAHHHHHHLQNNGMASPVAAAAAHDFYNSYGHSAMPRYTELHDTPTAAAATAATAAAAAAVSSGSYFQNWMISPPTEFAGMSGHIPDGYHSFGAPGSNSPGGTQYQSFIQYENGVPIRCIKRRVTANKKERRRTLSINNAFSQLRGCIPNVPSDTKLSKIKTLRLATSYISYLMDILAKDEPEANETGGFKADLTKKTSSNASSSTSSSSTSSSQQQLPLHHHHHHPSSAAAGGVAHGGSGGMMCHGKADQSMINSISQARTILDNSRIDEKRKRDSVSLSFCYLSIC